MIFNDFLIKGPNQEDMKANFDEALNDDALGDYSPSQRCEGKEEAKYYKAIEYVKNIIKYLDEAKLLKLPNPKADIES